MSDGVTGNVGVLRRAWEGAKARSRTPRNSNLRFQIPDISSRLSLRLRALAVSSLLILATAPGCKDIGRGGTGEMVVPEDVLREIKTVEPENFATTPPTTAPSTMPTTRATTQPLHDVP